MSDVGSLFQSVGAAWQKERFDSLILDVLTLRARVIKYEERVKLETEMKSKK